MEASLCAADEHYISFKDTEYLIHFPPIFSCGKVYVRWSIPGGSVVKDLPEMQKTQEMWVQSLGWEDPMKEVMATHSRILAWKIPWTESLVGYGPKGCKELDMTQLLSTKTHIHKMYHYSYV